MRLPVLLRGLGSTCFSPSGPLARSVRAARRWLLLPLLLLLFHSAISAPYIPIRYVKPTATGNGDGSSWDNASGDLQAMINNSSPTDQVWIAAGIYKPTTGTNRSVSFAMKNGVAIYGGFLGSETSLSARPAITLTTPSATTLSGDIGTVGDKRDNSYHVISNPAGLTNTAILDGFVITGGNANDTGGSNYAGGGVFNNGNGSGNVCSPTLTNCLFLSNSASGSGGAMYNRGTSGGTSSPTLTNCAFLSNLASSVGGAMVNDGSSGTSSPTLTNCAFQSNASDYGGAMFNDGSSGTSSPTLTNCSFLSNSASESGGAMYNSGTGGTSSPTLTNCVLFDNGGANTFFNDGATVVASYSLFDASVTGYNTTGTGNLTTGTTPFASPTSVALAPMSPAINAGNPASMTVTAGPYSATNLPTTDLAGNPRIVTGRVDMGAVEVQAAVCDPVVITTQPAAGLAGCAGSTVTAFVSASGSVSGYQWYKGSTAVSGQTSATLTLGNVSSADAGSYSVVVSSTCNSVTSAAFSLTVNAPPTRLYVRAEASGANTGLTWADAFTDLQSALRYSCTQSLSEIWVASGTYKPTTTTGPDSRTVSFVMLKDVRILGGFPNTGSPTLSERNAGSNLTTLSGDIGTMGDRSDNSYHIIKNQSVLTTTAVLDGFIITGGNADGDNGNERGAGMYNVGGGGSNSCSPTVRNCSFINNTASFGGAMFNDGRNEGNSSPVLINCSFVNNSASQYGGAISNSGNRGSSNPVFTNCSFLNNTAQLGGVIYSQAVFGNSTSTLTNCVLFGNGDFAFLNGGSSQFSITYSLFETGVDVADVSGPGNLTTASSPFISATSTLLNACALAINAGSNADYVAANGPAIDLATNPRVFPSGGSIDMGASEFQDIPSEQTILTTQPVAGSSVCAGGMATASVSASGTGPFTYQWFKEGSVISGQTSATLSLSNLKTSDAGNYLAVATGTCNSVTSTAFSLVVNAPPIVSLMASSAATCAPNAITLTANGSGTSFTFSAGATQIGTTNQAIVAQSGSYSVTVSNANGCTATASTSVTVNQPPAAPTLTSANRQVVQSTTPLPLNQFASATGSNTLSFSNVNGLIYHTPEADVSQLGVQSFSVSQTNANGCTSPVTPFTITVVPAGPPATQTVCRSSAVVLTVSKAGSRYEWYKNGTSAPFKLTEIASIQKGTATSSLTIVSAQTSAPYYCKVFQANGSFVFEGPYQVSINYNCTTPNARVAAAESIEIPLSVTVAPNPVVSESLRAVVRGAGGASLTVDLVDLRGTTVQTQQWPVADGEQVVEWSVGNRPAGLYLLRAQSNGQLQTVKIIKQ